MNPRELTKRAIVLATVAAALGRLVVTDDYLAYVKPGMRLPLVLSVAMVAVLAFASAAFADQARDGDPPGHPDHRDAADGSDPEDHDHDHGHDHDHSRFPPVGWWMLAPVICIALVPLAPLGAEAVTGRQANAVSVRQPATGADPPTSPSTTGGDVTLLAFVDRTINDPSNPFTEPVTLVGFVTEDAAVDDGFVISRFVMSCCAADALPLSVRVRWYEEPPAVGEWVEITGTHVPADPDLPDAARPLTENIVLDADEVEVIDQPTEPYESP